MASVRSYIQENLEVVGVAVIGSVAVGVGIAFGLCSNNHPHIYTISISIGTSLIAAALVTLLSPVSREVYQRFVRLGIQDVYPSRDEIPKKRWILWLRGARHRCVILGIANNNWCRDGDFESALFDRLRSKVEVEVFFLNPLSIEVTTRAKEDEGRDTEETIRKSIEMLWRCKQKLASDSRVQERLKLYVYSATPSSGMTWVDSIMIVTHYLAGFANVTSPALIVKPVQNEPGQRDLYSTYAENLERVRGRATLLSDANVGQFLPPQKEEKGE
jgi:Domain of unknown function (DUF5919)